MSHFNLHTINPYVRVAMRSVLKKGTHIRRRIIFDYELIYIERGSFVFTYANQSYPCRAGQFLLIRPGIPHSFEKITKDLSQPHVHFDMIYSSDSVRTPVSFKDLFELSREERSLIQEDLFADLGNTPFVSFDDQEATVAQLFKVIDCHGAGTPLLAKSALCELIDRLIRVNLPTLLSAPEPSIHTISRQLKDFIDASPSAPIDLTAIEQQFSYSRFYLERQFKQSYGLGIIAYRNERRLTLAKEMLSEQTSISKIAEQLGYSSIYAFSRAFKSRYGISPSFHRRSNT